MDKPVLRENADLRVHLVSTERWGLKVLLGHQVLQDPTDLMALQALPDNLVLMGVWVVMENPGFLDPKEKWGPPDHLVQLVHRVLKVLWVLKVLKVSAVIKVVTGPKACVERSVIKALLVVLVLGVHEDPQDLLELKDPEVLMEPMEWLVLQDRLVLLESPVNQVKWGLLVLLVRLELLVLEVQTVQQDRLVQLVNLVNLVLLVFR